MHSLEIDDPDVLSNVPLGRSRFFRFMGAGLVSAATAWVLRGQPAMAHNLAVPYPCFGFGKCHHCSGRICTQYCSWPNGHGADHNCPTGAQCWNTCVLDSPGYKLYRCCDWHANFPVAGFHHCICVEPWGSC